MYITLEDDELETLQVESTHTIEIDSFVPRDQLDERYFDSPYYIVPNDKVGQDAFVVIRDAMKGKGMVGIGRVVIAKRERPIILEPFGKGLRAMTLRYAYEVRDETEYFTDIPDRRSRDSLIGNIRERTTAILQSFDSVEGPQRRRHRNCDVPAEASVALFAG